MGMVHNLKKHYYMILLVLFSLALVITKAPYAYQQHGTEAFWIYGWVASAILVGLHECKAVLLDYVKDKTKVPFLLRVIKIAVWGMFIIAVIVEFVK